MTVPIYFFSVYTLRFLHWRCKLNTCLPKNLSNLLNYLRGYSHLQNGMLKLVNEEKSRRNILNSKPRMTKCFRRVGVSCYPCITSHINQDQVKYVIIKRKHGVNMLKSLFAKNRLYYMSIKSKTYADRNKEDTSLLIWYYIFNFSL